MSGLMASGIELMLVGMGTVFVFLTLLVGATTLMSTLVQKIVPPAVKDESDDEIAAITAAIHLHEQLRKGK